MNNLRSLTLLDGFIRNEVVNEGLGHIISLRFLLESFDISYVLYLERVPMIRRACVVLLACFSEWGVPYWSAACWLPVPSIPSSKSESLSQNPSAPPSNRWYRRLRCV